jgi:hypothetical protein
MNIRAPVIFFKASHFDMYAPFFVEDAVLLLVVGAATSGAGPLQAIF